MDELHHISDATDLSDRAREIIDHMLPGYERLAVAAVRDGKPVAEFVSEMMMLDAAAARQRVAENRVRLLANLVVCEREARAIFEASSAGGIWQARSAANRVLQRVSHIRAGIDDDRYALSLAMGDLVWDLWEANVVVRDYRPAAMAMAIAEANADGRLNRKRASGGGKKRAQKIRAENAAIAATINSETDTKRRRKIVRDLAEQTGKTPARLERIAREARRAAEGPTGM